jgi:hypothetical protein
LGNQTQPTFLHKDPHGTTWQGEFPLDSVPLGAATLRIKAAELEPSGQETPLGSRHLPELRNGGLGTEFLLNGTSLGRLNDLISRKAHRDAPAEIRVPIPAGLLKAGRNTWAIRQSPLPSRPQEFDDCELGPIVLDIEQTPRD